MQSSSILARSCAACRRRKIRCDRSRPSCAYCAKMGLTCDYPPTRKGQHGEAPRTTDGATHAQMPSAANTTTLDPEPSASTATGTSDATPATPPSTRAPFWARISAEAAATDAAGFPDLQASDGARTRGDDASTPDLWHSLRPLSSADAAQSCLRDCHPSGADAFCLWQTFLDNVDPLIKILHTPTVQSRLLKAIRDLDGVDAAFEALLFAIYYAATISMCDADAQDKDAQQSRAAELAKYRVALNCALTQAQFFARGQDVVSLQAFVLYLVCARFDKHGPSIWAMATIAIRIGMRLRIHREKADTTLPPFEVEMQRRLWWQICTLDVRIAEDEGIEPFVPQPFLQVPLPKRVSDLEIQPEMRHAPNVSKNSIALFYNNARVECTRGLRNILFPHNSLLDEVRDDTTALIKKFEAINALKRRMEEEYFNDCDMSIPLCYFTVTTVNLVFKKAVLTLYLTDGSAQYPEPSEEHLFRTSVEVLEGTHTLITSSQYGRWWWLFRTYVEWDALALIFIGLCRWPHRENTDAAWKAVETAWPYAQSLAEASSHKQRWNSLCRLKTRAEAMSRQLRSSENPSPERDVARHVQNGSTPRPAELSEKYDGEFVGVQEDEMGLLNEDWSWLFDRELMTGYAWL